MIKVCFNVRTELHVFFIRYMSFYNLLRMNGDQYHGDIVQADFQTEFRIIL